MRQLGVSQLEGDRKRNFGNAKERIICIYLRMHLFILFAKRQNVHSMFSDIKKRLSFQIVFGFLVQEEEEAVQRSNRKDEEK